ncbi:cell division protein FtsA [Marinilactibacillus piezotolerans]|uniref:cell division protein FtsA n=1 Tax=Marinilactibacillus piezotolerans TaxID=258723 RepID=UPI0009AF67F0|nr:cell division protein FtsA [Marinilactibacillus piezotolerans]
MENGIYTSLDIGTTSIKVIVAEVLNNQMNVIGVGSEKSKGINKGMIVDIDETSNAIAHAVKQAEEKSGLEIQDLVVGIPANGVEIIPFNGYIQIDDSSQEISDQDVEQLIRETCLTKVPSDKEMISIMVEEFLVDGFDEIKDPRGMVGERLELYGTMLAIPKSIVHNIKKCVQKSGHGIQDLILQPQAMAQLVLSEDERQFGTVQIDIGGGQTTASAIHDHQLKYVYVEQQGGEFITKDISLVLNTSLQNAESLKREVGYAFSSQASADQTVLVDVVGEKEPVRVKESYIAEIIEARVEQIFETLKAELNRIGALSLPGKVKLTGGAAAIPGIRELAEDIFEVEVAVYIPDYMGVRYPSFTNAISLVYYEGKLEGIQKLINQVSLSNHGLISAGQIQQPQSKSEYTQSSSHNETNAHSSNSSEKQPFTEKIKNFFSTFFD